MSDDVQQPGPDEIARSGRISPEDDTESHGYRKISNPAVPEAPGPDGGRRLSLTADDTDDDVEGHYKRH